MLLRDNFGVSDETFRYVQCTGCRTWVQNPRPVIDEIAQFYQADFVADRPAIERSAIGKLALWVRDATVYFSSVKLALDHTVLIAAGGLFGELNTMYAAFAARVRELGALQALGFPRRAIVLSLLQESVLTTAAGALVAAGLGVWLLDGVGVRFSTGAMTLVMDGPVLALGLVAGLLLGILGAGPPAWRCLHLPIAEALKSA